MNDSERLDIKQAIERLAIAQAVYNGFGGVVSTKDPDNLRGTVDTYFRELYETTGAKTMEVKVSGEKVGTYSVRVSKEEPGKTVREFTVTDKQKAAMAASQLSEDAWWMYVYENLDDFLDWYASETGEVLDGCGIVETIYPGTPPAYAGGTLKVDARKVAEVVAANNLDYGVAGLLGGNDD